MARSHGRILARIWSDDDFRALPVQAQQLYLLLLSQPNLTHAGTLPVTVRRWANMTEGATTETVLAALRVLSDRRFVVVEWDTEELLVRTLIRNDGVFKQPKVLRAAKADAEAVTSSKIRRALRKEIMRCPLDEVTANAREEVSGLLTALAEALDTPPDDPNGGVSDTHTDTPAEVTAVPEAKAPRSASAGSPALSPTPAPSPAPSPAVSDGARGALALVQPEDASPTVASLIAVFVENCSKRPPSQTISRFGKAVKELLADGQDPDDIRAGLVVAAHDGCGATQLATVVHQAMNRRPRGGSNMDDHFALIQRLPSFDFEQGESA